VTLDDNASARVVEAIRTINRICDLGDAVYQIRESVQSQSEMNKLGCDSWSTPVMNEYSAALQVLKTEGVL